MSLQQVDQLIHGGDLVDLIGTDQQSKSIRLTDEDCWQLDIRDSVATR